VLLLQHSALVLVFKQKLCLSLTEWLGWLSSFFPVFQWQLLSQLPQWGVACLQVPKISSVVHQPSFFWVGFSLCWFTGGLFLYLNPFLWGKVRDLSAGSLLSACYAVCWLFFNFAMLFNFGCCSPAQKMTSVHHYLPYFRQWLITHLLSAHLPFQSLFRVSLHGDQLLASLPPSLMCL
jgi:hypothetical protein